MLNHCAAQFSQILRILANIRVPAIRAARWRQVLAEVIALHAVALGERDSARVTVEDAEQVKFKFVIMF